MYIPCLIESSFSRNTLSVKYIVASLFVCLFAFLRLVFLNAMMNTQTENVHLIADNASMTYQTAQQLREDQRTGVNGNASVGTAIAHDNSLAAGPAAVAPNAGFTRTPIYDTHSGLGGTLQATGDMQAFSNRHRESQDMLNYMSIPPVYQYGVQSPVTNQISREEYLNYLANQAYNPPYMQQQQQRHLMYQNYPQQYDMLQSQQMQKQNQLRTTSVDPTGESTIIHGLPKTLGYTYDKCPTVCSLFAILCCPITLWCSLPALIYSICAYTDYRAADLQRYQRKSDIARQLVITACVVGLLVCIIWALLAVFYYYAIIQLVNDIVQAISSRNRYGT